MLKRIVIPFATVLLTAFAVFSVYANLQRKFGWGIVGVTEDSPSNNLSALLISIVDYETTYKRCPEHLSVLGPPGQGQAVDSQAAGLIAADLASGKHAGYLYEYHRIADAKSCEFTITTDPADARTGKFHYFTDHTGVKRFEIDRPATVNSPQYKRDN
jgi:hypothetical protein